MNQDGGVDNARRAAHNRRWLARRGVTAINVMSSPGAGKTTLLARTRRDARLPIAVIDGDRAAAPARPAAACHLDAAMIERALPVIDPRPGSVVMIENVGNLACPVRFDLGEAARVVIASVADGDDKPVKYPQMFRAATVIVLNKLDLLPHVAFDLARFSAFARRINHDVAILPVSAVRGDGLGDWYGWLETARYAA